jgi:precorrin-8X/cobalt-precorrin-8 methylmutase
MKRVVLIGDGPYYEALKGLSIEGLVICGVSEAEETIKDVLNKTEGPLYVHIFSDEGTLYGSLKVIAPERLVFSTEAPEQVSKQMLKAMEVLPTEGPEIERLSFEILAGGLDLGGLPPEARPLLKRVVHATGDRSFASTLVLHPEAVKTGIRAITQGLDIVTDVEMVRAGINQRVLGAFGGRVLCAVRDVSPAKGHGTRTERAIEMLLRENPRVGILAIGNSPSALVKAVELLGGPFRDRAKDILVVGMPVGFVRALESKVLLSMQNFPFITNISTKGGSPATVATVNALLYMTSAERQQGAQQE